MTTEALPPTDPFTARLVDGRTIDIHRATYRIDTDEHRAAGVVDGKWVLVSRPGWAHSWTVTKECTE